MIDYILPFIVEKDKRAIPPYQLFLKDQKTLIEERLQRFKLTTGHEFGGVKLLRYILQFVDMNYLDQQSNNYERYTYHLRYICRDLMNIFDKVKEGRGFRRLFFYSSSSMPVEEFLFPIEDINTIVNLPLDTESWDIWQHVKPLHIWNHNSDEYSINLLSDRIRFASFPPHYVIELLDVVALAMKYYIWYKYQRTNELAEEFALLNPQQLFLHKYVVTDVIWDLADIWLLHKLRALLTDVRENNYNLENYDAQVMQTDTQYGRIASYSRRGFESLYKLISMVKHNNINPEALLSSKTLMTGSIINRIIKTTKLSLPVFRQYDYMRWMRDVDLIVLFKDIYNLRPNLPTTKRLNIHLRRMLNRFYRTKPWQYCNNIYLKEDIQQQLLKIKDQ